MTDSVLDLLKWALLGLLYLFFARVLWAVWSEVRPTRSLGPMPTTTITPSAPAATGPGSEAEVPTTAAGRPRLRSRADEAAATESPGRRTRSRGRAVRLVVLEPKDRRNQTFTISGTLRIGRDEINEIQLLDDPYVSTTHARVFESEGQPMVEDLGSTNGTFHNGNKLTGARLLHPGDRVQIGRTVFEAR